MRGRHIALVTGSTSGIGLAIALKFASSDFDVAVHGVEPEEEVAEILQFLRQAGRGRVWYARADLADAKASMGLVQSVVDALGGLDVLVNNAGIQKVAAVSDFAEEDWQRLMSVNLDAAFHTMRSAMPHMLAGGWGRVINIASAHGLRASPYKSAYVAAKHALVGLTKTAALEVAESNVTVNAICPGYVWTPLVAKQVQDQARVHGISEDEVISKIILAPQPSKKFVQPEEVAELAAYLCSDWARSITGSAISIDGGWTAK
ncbi:MAG: 3-hydroxybutyrate dehydrogenase [Devosia sp.]|jgi:3-hydroxybutyrate dehydrogenase|uniref:3-hydroxybutyrate dehydrogenase n=1 Tax=unclassified Devosia TaxID=196773 RepID=UPI001A01E463|nr:MULTISPECIES: 3-hydroxybutyrate dehydrogenase [unclassified Devosia]MBF0677711.1 3-hydroxybutyrate dehydrogenase [Devosia sp.]WEJ34234.1 3-hydroxybutyrate dehydrogenase [Devosia sp. SD17-2]